MRYSAFIFLAICLAFACVKPKTKDPLPVLEYESATLERAPATGTMPERDTASLVIGYQDGDGDIFRNSNADGPNFFYVVYKLDASTGKMVRDSSAGSVSAVNALVINQPANGYYKGKSIEGDITVPLSEFRSSKNIHVLQFQCSMVDMKNHRSNVVTSPVYTFTP